MFVCPSDIFVRPRETKFARKMRLLVALVVSHCAAHATRHQPPTPAGSSGFRCSLAPAHHILGTSVSQTSSNMSMLAMLPAPSASTCHCQHGHLLLSRPPVTATVTRVRLAAGQRSLAAGQRSLAARPTSRPAAATPLAHARARSLTTTAAADKPILYDVPISNNGRGLHSFNSELNLRTFVTHRSRKSST
jgi:hypothetical protein